MKNKPTYEELLQAIKAAHTILESANNSDQNAIMLANWNLCKVLYPDKKESKEIEAHDKEKAVEVERDKEVKGLALSLPLSSDNPQLIEFKKSIDLMLDNLNKQFPSKLSN